MSLSKKDRVELEMDGFTLIKWQTVSDVGTQISQGQSGRDPKTGKIIKTPGSRENRPLELSKIFDPDKDKALVSLLLDESPQAFFKSGKLKATLVYYGDSNNVEAKYILTGLTLSSHTIPGSDAIQKGFGMLSMSLEYESIKSV